MLDKIDQTYMEKPEEQSKEGIAADLESKDEEEGELRDDLKSKDFREYLATDEDEEERSTIFEQLTTYCEQRLLLNILIQQRIRHFCNSSLIESKNRAKELWDRNMEVVKGELEYGKVKVEDVISSFI